MYTNNYTTWQIDKNKGGTFRALCDAYNIAVMNKNITKPKQKKRRMLKNTQYAFGAGKQRWREITSTKTHR